MAEDQDPLEDAPDPTEDTPDDDSEDTADDQPEGSIDWEARYKEARKAIAKQGRELAAFRQSEPDESDEDEPDDEDEPTEVEAPGEQYERDSWKLAESLYGEEAIDAYTAAEKLTRKATTPADWVAAFEAYHEIRSGKRRAEPDPAPADGRKSRDKAVEPRVDNNRSDQAPDLTQDFEEARKSGSLDAFTRAATAALGLGPKKRS